MAQGNISNTERYKRLSEIKRLIDEDKSPDEISSETGLSLSVVKTNIKYLDELSTIDLSPVEIGKRREELYVELIEATEEARKMFQYYKQNDKATSAHMFFTAWLNSINLRASLFGLDKVPSTPTNQVNTQINNYSREKIDSSIGSKIADMIKKQHEDSRKE